MVVCTALLTAAIGRADDFARVESQIDRSRAERVQPAAIRFRPDCSPMAFRTPRRPRQRRMRKASATTRHRHPCFWISSAPLRRPRKAPQHGLLCRTMMPTSDFTQNTEVGGRIPARLFGIERHEGASSHRSSQPPPHADCAKFRRIDARRLRARSQPLVERWSCSHALRSTDETIISSRTVYE